MTTLTGKKVNSLHWPFIYSAIDTVKKHHVLA